MQNKSIRFAYRITHISNIENILKVGIVKPSSPNANPNFISIGDTTVIATRLTKRLSDGSIIGDYIPFYFGPRTPMLYVIQNGLNNVKQQNPSDIVYCVISLQDIINSKIDCVFTDGHALDKISRVYPCSQLSQIDQIINYDSVYATFWNTAPDLKRKKEAELLLKNDLPAVFIKYYLVYNEVAQNTLLKLGIEAKKIRIAPHFYF